MEVKSLIKKVLQPLTKVILFLTVVMLLIFSANVFAQESLTSYLQQARKAVEEGNYDLAINIYRSVLREDKDNFLAQVELARTYYFAANTKSQYYGQAIENYRVVIDKWPSFSLPYLHLGEIAYILGKRCEQNGEKSHAKGLYESALSWLNQYITLEEKGKTLGNKRNATKGKVMLSIVYNRLAQREKSIDLITSAIKDYKNFASPGWGQTPLFDFFLKSGLDYMKDKLYQQALIYLEGAWLINPQPQIKSLIDGIAKEKGPKLALTEPLFPLREMPSSPEKPSSASTSESPQLLSSEIKSQIEELKKAIEDIRHRLEQVEKKITQIEGEIQ